MLAYNKVALIQSSVQLFILDRICHLGYAFSPCGHGVRWVAWVYQYPWSDDNWFMQLLYVPSMLSSFSILLYGGQIYKLMHSWYYCVVCT